MAIVAGMVHDLSQSFPLILSHVFLMSNQIQSSFNIDTLNFALLIIE